MRLICSSSSSGAGSRSARARASPRSSPRPARPARSVGSALARARRPAAPRALPGDGRSSSRAIGRDCSDRRWPAAPALGAEVELEIEISSRRSAGRVGRRATGTRRRRPPGGLPRLRRRSPRPSSRAAASAAGRGQVVSGQARSAAADHDAAAGAVGCSERGVGAAQRRGGGLQRATPEAVEGSRRARCASTQRPSSASAVAVNSSSGASAGRCSASRVL